ncbi:MAG: permease [Myxococcales bacterium]|nr:permease [Myxococcales bacterium]
MPQPFIDGWAKAALTSVGFFWTAFWAFGLGYVVSALIKTFVTEARVKRALGGDGPKSVGLATFFGFISSSCSFAALGTTRSIFGKGAGLAPSLAFLLASTNLVIELGIVIALFLSWQFVVGEYLGGLLLILVVWGLLKLIKPTRLIRKARERVSDDDDERVPDWRRLIRKREGWAKACDAYIREWLMVWKDVTVGFGVAGAIAAFVPGSFFQSLFVGSGGEEQSLGTVVAQSLIGPIAAFFTFIGSMGNIPLAAVLFGSGVSFAGVMAFIFSDLVVFPVLRVQAKYYGWKFALFVAGLFLTAIVVTSVAMHYGLLALGTLPESSVAHGGDPDPLSRFDFGYGFWLNLVFLALSAGASVWFVRRHPPQLGFPSGWLDRVLVVLAVLVFVWVGGGVACWASGVAHVT